MHVWHVSPVQILETPTFSLLYLVFLHKEPVENLPAADCLHFFITQYLQMMIGEDSRETLERASLCFAEWIDFLNLFV